MKRVLLGILSLIILIATWYFFIKPYDYRVSFEVPTSLGDVNQSIKSWDSSLKNSKGITQINFQELQQELRFGDSTHIYHWSFSKKNDSIAKVTLQTKDDAHRMANKWDVLWGKGVIKENTVTKAKAFLDLIHKHLSEIRITIEGESETVTTYCAYISFKSLQIQKARSMMKDIGFLGSAIVNTDIENNGPPIIEITHWDKATDSIHYNFCFPIKPMQNYPEYGDISYKKLFKKKALKATYNGNYITSDRAWYALQEYAERHNIEVEPYPLEVFYNNPNMGGDELNWKAEIFLPIVEKVEL